MAMGPKCVRAGTPGYTTPKYQTEVNGENAGFTFYSRPSTALSLTNETPEPSSQTGLTKDLGDLQGKTRNIKDLQGEMAHAS